MHRPYAVTSPSLARAGHSAATALPLSPDLTRPAEKSTTPIGARPERAEGLPARGALEAVGRGLMGGLVGVLIDALRPSRPQTSKQRRATERSGRHEGRPQPASPSTQGSQPIRPQWPWRVPSDLASPDSAQDHAPLPHSPGTASRAVTLKVMPQLDEKTAQGCAGRMVITGRMADVCAELDRLALRQVHR